MQTEPEELKEYNAVIGILGGDAKRAEDEWRRDPTSQFHRRTYVRAGFAYIEGHVYRLKQLILSLDNHKLGLQSQRGGAPSPNAPAVLTVLTGGDRLILEEQSFDVDDKGNSYAKQAFVRLDKNIKFAFRTFAKATDIPFKLDLETAGWRAFQKATEVRNRITHPKSISDLSISDTEIDTVHNGFVWYLNSANRCLSMLFEETAKRTAVMNGTKMTVLRKIQKGGTTPP